MTELKKNKIIAKPFVKWAGGKASLINQFIDYLPSDFKEQQEVTYIEPFVGGGAMLFYMLTHYSNIKRAIINDVNNDLIGCYKLIKNNPTKLVELLRNIGIEYNQLSSIEDKTKFYYLMREKYNKADITVEERAACFIFLNKTCFNGLYRVNKNGKFNVPFGKYKRPNICDEELIMAVHEVLKMVEIYVGDYQNITQFVGEGYSLIYMDPPYRPLSGSACFIEYTRNTFDDREQEKLKTYCDILTQKGCRIMQSNSNSLNNNGESYFAELYDTYYIKQIKAHRFINAHAGKREKETELLILNYCNSSNSITE